MKPQGNNYEEQRHLAKAFLGTLYVLTIEYAQPLTDKGIKLLVYQAYGMSKSFEILIFVFLQKDAKQ